MSQETHAGLGELFRVWGKEAAHLSTISEQIQTILVVACAQAAGNDSFHREVQACDLLTQTLSAMSSFMLSVADVTPQDWTVDITQATQALPLCDLAAMVSSTARPREQTVSGELELFA